MPKNRYAPMFNGVFYSDNGTELYCEDNFYGTAKGTATLASVDTSDWANIANNMPISIWFFDADGIQSSTRAFYGIVASSKYITQKCVEVSFEDLSLKLKRWPVNKDIIKDRYQYSRENATVGELVNIFATEEMVASGGTLIVSLGTIDGSSEVVGKFVGTYTSRWDMFLKLAQQLKRIAYCDNGGLLQLRSVRGYSLADSGSGVASGLTFTDNSKSWSVNAYRGYVLIGTKSSFMISSNTSNALTVAGTVGTDEPTSGDYQIADMVQARGTGTASGSTFTVTAAGWDVNQWTGYTLLDVGSSYVIISNTSDTLTVSGNPVTGAFQILMGFYSSGGSKNAAFSDRQYNGYNIWNDVTVVGANGVTANYRDISTKVAYTTQSDTRLARDLDSENDTTIYVESLVGIPNEPGIVLIQNGTRKDWTGSTVFSKKSGIFYYTGTSGNTLTGVSCWNTYSVPLVESGGLGGAVYSARTKVQFLHKLRVTSTTGFATSGNLLIGTEVIPYSSKGNDYFLLGDVGTGAASGSTFTDSSKFWASGQWIGYVLVDTSSGGTPTGVGYPITANTSTQLTVTGSPISGTYMIVRGIANLAVMFRPPIISTALTAYAQATDTSLTVTSTSAFDSSGTLKIYGSGGGVEIVDYASKDSTHFLACSRGAQNTTPIEMPIGSAAISYYASGIHPTQVRVQQYPSGGVPETGSSRQVNGLCQKQFPYPYAITIENVEQIASRLLMNHRWGDQFIQFCGYAPRHYQNVNIGNVVQFTDTTLDLNRYTEKVVRKELHQHFADGEFFSRFSIGVQPKSDTDKLLDKIYELVGMKNPNNQQYITGDTPIDILTLQCGSPAVRLNAPGLDASNVSGKGFINSNYLWLQPFDASGTQFRPTPFYSYGAMIDSGGLIFPGMAGTDPTTTEVTTGLEGSIYYNYTSHTLRWHNGTAWADFGSGGSGGGYWSRSDLGGGIFQLAPTTAGDNVYTSGSISCDGVLSGLTLIATNINLVYSGTSYLAFSMWNSTDIKVSRHLLPSSSTKNIGSATTYWNSIFASELNALTSASVGGNDAYHWFYSPDANNIEYDAFGSSTDINMILNPKGTGAVFVSGGVHPYSDNTRDLGIPDTYRWRSVYAVTGYYGAAASRVKISGSGIVSDGSNANIDMYVTPKGYGYLWLGVSTGEVMSLTDIIPTVNNLKNLGASAYRWATIYANAINVLSSSVVSNLNADMLDGLHSSSFLSVPMTVDLTVSGSHSVGSNSTRWNAGYFNTVYAGSGIDAYASIYRESSSSVKMLADGSSSNIDLNLTTKGTGSLYINAGNTFTGNVKPASASSYVLGLTGTRWLAGYFDNLYCTNKNAANYITGHIHENIRGNEVDSVSDGDVVVFKNGKIALSNEPNDKAVFGVIDTDMTHVVDDEAKPSEFPRPVILGIFKIRVTGQVKEGDLLCTSYIKGTAHAVADPKVGTVIAQAMDSFDGRYGEKSAVIRAMIRKM